MSSYYDDEDFREEYLRRDEESLDHEISERERNKVCRSCGKAGGPYPNGDRPKSSNPLQSGCPRCGWCL